MRNPLIHHQKSARPLSPLRRLQGDVLGLRTVLLEVAVRGRVLHRDDHGVHAAVAVEHGLLILHRRRRRWRELFDGVRRRRREAVGRAPLGRRRGVEVQLGEVDGLLGNDLDVGERGEQVRVGRGGETGRRRGQRRRRGKAGLQVGGRSHRGRRLGGRVGRGR